LATNLAIAAKVQAMRRLRILGAAVPLLLGAPIEREGDERDNGHH
jgi:hypothetical protein